MSDADIIEDEPRPPIQQTGSIRVPKRRRLGGIVIATVAGCGLILLAAVIARVSQASSARHDPATSATAASTEATATPQAAPAAAAPSPTAAAPTAAAAPPRPAEAPTTGTLRLKRPAVAGRVWIDGKKVSSTSVVVGCGAHQLKVGPRARAHTVDIPCGGELVVTK